MKKYIFFTYQIHEIGGTQLVVAGKAAYLEKHGWEVYVFTSGKSNGESQIPSLTKYISGCGFLEMCKRPYKVSGNDRNRALDRMVDILRVDETIENEIIIESHYDVVAYWAELLAERIHARHFALILNAYFRGDNRFYFENLDFFYIKYLRGELMTDPKLFNGYRNLDVLSYNGLPEDCNWGCEQDPIQDVNNPNIDMVYDDKNNDYTITYIGRPQKKYLEPMFHGIVKFAQKYSDKTIRFIVVGNFSGTKQFTMFTDISNINLVFVGVLVPIPKKLFRCTDVVIAGDQTAIFCAEENVPVITPIIGSDKTAGVLYYDTDDPWYGTGAPSISYTKALEKVLIRQECSNWKPNLPERHPAEWHYEQMINWQRNNQFPLEYFTKKFKLDLRRDWVAIFPFRLVERGAKIVLYGIDEIYEDYAMQAEGYCNIVAVVADDYEHYDRTVLPPEKLAELKYDGIVISKMVDQEELNEIGTKIFNITGKLNIVCEFTLIHV